MLNTAEEGLVLIQGLPLALETKAEEGLGGRAEEGPGADEGLE